MRGFLEIGWLLTLDMRFTGSSNCCSSDFIFVDSSEASVLKHHDSVQQSPELKNA